MWLTSLDDRVRDSHRGAHGAAGRLDEPFIVGGNACEVPGECGVAEDDGGVANERGALQDLLRRVRGLERMIGRVLGARAMVLVGADEEGSCSEGRSQWRRPSSVG
ncbi:MAG: hypothetical protein IPJ58_13140 [Ardenticatenia bacterium]|nr:hypothetical protein [Ardenticatenia bacterium]